MSHLKFLSLINRISISGVITVSSRIKPLSLQLANQIAAGEVVERPSSVVKELLENAIDAHSSQIHIDIERGGSALIRIVDNGDGINKDDLALAVSRHATSKIKTLNELEHSLSLGFRGEALASISAVSKLSIKSRQLDSDNAWMINTGNDSDFADYNAPPQPVAHPQGTTIEVRDLFFNTPARRKFMRTIKTEFRHIDDIVKRIALSQFDIAFKLSHNKKLLRNLPKAVTENAITQRISKLFSTEFLDNANRVDFSADHFSNMGSIRLWGWISKPQWHRKQSDWQYFYVNGRYIKDKLVNHALRQAYQEFLAEDTFSAYLLFLEIDAQQVDVNVHPTKHEVRFRQTRLVHDFIYSGLKEALYFKQESKQELQAASEIESIKQISDTGNNGQYINRFSQSTQYQPQTITKISQHQVAEQLTGLTQLYKQKNQEVSQKPEPLAQRSLFFGTSLGCLIPGYILSQSINSEQGVQLFIINILRAQQFLIKQLFQTGEKTPLLIPETLNFSSKKIELLVSCQTALQHWGMELSQLGEQSLIVRSTPSLYNIPACKISLKTLVAAVLHTIKDKGSLDKEELLDALINSIHSNSLSLSDQALLLSLLAQQIDQSKIEQAAKIKPAIWKTLDAADLNKLLD